MTNVTQTLAEVDATESVLRLVLIPTVVYGVFAVVCFFFFGLAVAKGCIADLAPRSSNRPSRILKDALLYNNPITFLPFAWIYWGYKVTYQQCLVDGIPATNNNNDNDNDNNNNNNNNK